MADALFSLICQTLVFVLTETCVCHDRHKCLSHQLQVSDKTAAEACPQPCPKPL
ncbi:Uncharacterised protein [Bacteroides heparinolyticus]|uniref:Uncharacterized protein n=1 Tax=Prevotella heparinolytica TaxID=28113 RepID=A0A449I1P2_9BACE|nr:Uncharacterised protein [Bacteroides heparinolyticus]